MLFFNAENFNEGIRQTLEEHQVDRLVKPQNSEYYYLKSLKFEDLELSCEYVYRYNTVVKYKAEAKYQSRKNARMKNKTESYSSSAIGIEIIESDGAERIPRDIYNRYRPTKPYWGPEMLSDVDKTIIHDATLKIKGKVRRGGDPIEKEDIHTLDIVSKTVERPEEPEYPFIWTPLVDKKSKSSIGYAVIFGKTVKYFFEPDRTKEGLEKKLKPQKPTPEPTPTVPKKPKAKKRRRSFSDLMSSLIAQLVIAVIIAVPLLLIEGLVLAFSDVGYKNKLGMYEINKDNFSEMIMLTSIVGSGHQKLNEEEKREEVAKLSTSTMVDYPLFNVVPRKCKFSLFDMSEKKSALYVGQYTSFSFLGIKETVPKYKISDLYVKVEVTYSYNGVEEKVIEEVYIPEIKTYEDTVVRIDLPEESMKSHTGEYYLNGKGDTYTMTHYWSDLDYWSVKILDISGYAERVEVTGK